MSKSDRTEPGRIKRRLATTAVAGGIFLAGAATIAGACIPWGGTYGIDQQNQNHDTTGETNGDLVRGADHTDVEADGTTGGDRGNGQGMIWCDDTDDAGPNDDTSDPFGQQYKWANVRTNDGAGWDVRLLVDDNNSATSNQGKADNIGGCGSDVYLPEDVYHITFQDDSFSNVDGSTADGEETYADNQDTDTNGDQGSTDAGDDDGSNEVTNNHCMDIDDDDTDDNHLEWDLTEDEDGIAENDEGDAAGVDDERFPSEHDLAPNGDQRDVVDEGPHRKKVNLDSGKFPVLDPSDSGDNDDGVAGVDAAGLCITSDENFEHDNDDVDDNDDEVAGGDRDEDAAGSGTFPIEYGNSIPVNILQFSS